MWSDPHENLKGLPVSLKTTLLLYSYYDLIKNIRILQVDPNFTASLLPYFKLQKLHKEEIVYREDDLSHESILL